MSDFRLPPLSSAERVYRVLLHLYPAEFRRRFGQEMIEAFRDERRDEERHGHSAATFWLSTVPDIVIHAFAERASSGWRILRRVDSPHDKSSLMASLAFALRLDELRYAVRRLRRVPSFSLTTLLVLALGIGATTAVFSIVNGVLLRPLPYPEPERLVGLWHTLTVPGLTRADQSDASYLLYRQEARLFQAIGASRDFDVNLEPAAGVTDASERVSATGITANLLEVFRVRPLRGRGFIDADDRKDAPRVVLLSEGLWRRKFGADPSIIGKRVVIDGTPREVVGIMSSDFRYPSAAVELWFPLQLDPAHANAGSFNYRAVARLAPGVTAEAAASDLERILPRLLEVFPSGIPPEMFAQAHLKPVVTPLRDVIVGDVGRLLWILLGSVFMLLLIACANVANLFLVRGESRQRELAVRTALGAGLAVVLAQYLSEALLLAAGGGIIGVGLAAIAVRAAGTTQSVLDIPRLSEVSIDAGVVAFAFALTLASAFAVSLIPLLRARKIPLATVLKDSGRSATTGAERHRTRSALVVLQVAVALVLVAASGLMTRSFSRLRSVSPGFDATGVLALRVALPSSKYTTSTSIMQFYDQLLAEVNGVAGVRGAALTTLLPLTSNHNDGVIEVENHPLPPNTIPRVHFMSQVSGDYFATMRIPLRAGRTFGLQDPQRASKEVIVSKAFARRYWEGSDALGKRLRPGIEGEWYVVVGVVDDVHLEALHKPAEDGIYLPLVEPTKTATATPRNVALVIRAGGDAAALTAPIRELVRSLDPALPIYDEQPMTAVVRAATARTRITMLLLAIASSLALVLGAVGIYGVMAYGVSLRQREIGVRLALGAKPSDVSKMISGQGITLAALGVAIGLVGTMATTGFMRGLLYDVSPTDPLTLGGTCVVLLAVALLASWIPARRAAAVHPGAALRGD